jgi:tetratricopeptide (TPR) repeat protein
VRFGLWQELLALPAPNPKLTGLTGGFLYGRTVALAATGRTAEARATLAQLQGLAGAVSADAPAGQNTIKDVLAVAIPVAAARIAAAEQRAPDAVTLLRQAVAAEDRLAYDEPGDWFFPARHLLGAELLRSGAAAEAESVYREDLRRNPRNGWSLYGLAAALHAEGKVRAAAEVSRQFDDAWKHADLSLESSAL